MEYKFDEKRVTENFQIMNQFNVINLIWKGDGDASVVCGIIECDKLE